MAIRTSDADDRLPTAGPDTDSYDRYSHVATDDGYIIYDIESADAWVQAKRTLALDEWR